MSYPGGVNGPERQEVRKPPEFGFGPGNLARHGNRVRVQFPGLGLRSAVRPKFRGEAEEAPRLLRTAHYYKLMGRPEVALKELEEAHRLAPGNLKVANALAQ